jgi:hypothetical protein
MDAKPGHDQLAPMALGMVRAWLADDYWTIGRIRDELVSLGAAPEAIAETFSIIAASLLTEATGDAAAVVDRKIAKRIGAQAREAA